MLLNKNKFNVNDYLDNCCGLNNESKEYISKILNISNIKIFKKGNYVYNEGDDVSHFYFILNGKIEISKYSDKYSKMILGILNKLDFFGIPELFETEHMVNAWCLEDSEVAMISKSIFFEKFLTDQKLVLKFMSMMGKMVGDLQSSLAIQSSEVKVVSYLNWLKNESGEVKEDGRIYIPKKYSHSKIADMLGLKRETVTRVLTTLKNNNTIEVTKDHFIILNPNTLSENSFSNRSVAGYYGSNK